jgi:serine protease Do
MLFHRLIAICALTSVFVSPIQLFAAPKSESTAPSKAETSKAIDMVRAWNTVNKSVYEKVSPAVVVITIVRAPVEGEDPSDPFEFYHRGPKKGPNYRDPAESQGSGFIVQANGYIYTNNHVIQGADKIKVRLKDGRIFDASLVGFDEKTDVAVIKIEAKNLPVVDMGDSDAIQPGEWTIALGAPYNLDYSFTCGPLSGKLRTLGATMYEEYLQTQAPINPGNSGGPLVDIEGKVIGINTLIKTRPGLGYNPQNALIGFAIPIKLAQKIGNLLITKGKVERPWIGVDIQTFSEAVKDLKGALKNVTQGVVIMAIQPDTPAVNSGLEPLDVITAIDGATIANARDLQKQVLDKQIGQVILLNVVRDGKPMEIELKTGLQPTTQQVSANVRSEPMPQSAASFGLTVQAIPKELADQYRMGQKDGVYISDVDEDSVAARSNLAPGTIITKVDGRKVVSPQGLKEALSKADPVLGSKLQIIRDGVRTFVILKKSGSGYSDRQRNLNEN